MGRAPCCEKMGLKKGPWSKEEDQLLMAFIDQYGHDNWRALPKRAGLLRCGKSCRLRWTNYLRLDIKRGNFTKEEEDTIIQLHHQLGNRWSKIAANLPGRTDNEIKNVWHTHLKKRLKAEHNTCSSTDKNQITSDLQIHDPCRQLDYSLTITNHCRRQLSSSSLSSSSDVTSAVDNFSPSVVDDNLENYLKLDDDFWSLENCTANIGRDYGYGFDILNLDDGMNFWSNLLELPYSLSSSLSM